MRKIIASACAVTAMGFAVALANADDSATSGMSNPSSDTSISAPSSGSVADSAAAKTDEMTTQTVTKYKNMKTCTDSSGVVYKAGKKGFDNCVAQLKKSAKKGEQMGGTSGTDSSASGQSNSATDSGKMNSSDSTSSSSGN